LKGENIFKFSTMCYKLETEEEKTIVGQRPAMNQLEGEAEESQREMVEVTNQNKICIYNRGLINTLLKWESSTIG
jgi:hypothetical protein